MWLMMRSVLCSALLVALSLLRFATAILKRITPIVESWVSQYQRRGFMTGRSMLANVADFVCEATRVSLKQLRGAIVLFDFEAAYPSLSHTYLIAAFSAAGFPCCLLNAIRCLYVNNCHFITVKGKVLVDSSSTSNGNSSAKGRSPWC